MPPLWAAQLEDISMRRIFLPKLAGILCITLCIAACAARCPRLSADSVGYQIDPAHDGNNVSSSLKPPLVIRWTANLGLENMAYPVMADGRVFVIGEDPTTQSD